MVADNNTGSLKLELQYRSRIGLDRHAIVDIIQRASITSQFLVIETVPENFPKSADDLIVLIRTVDATLSEGPPQVNLPRRKKVLTKSQLAEEVRTICFATTLALANSRLATEQPDVDRELVAASMMAAMFAFSLKPGIPEIN